MPAPRVLGGGDAAAGLEDVRRGGAGDGALLGRGVRGQEGVDGVVGLGGLGARGGLLGGVVDGAGGSRFFNVHGGEGGRRRGGDPFGARCLLGRRPLGPVR